MAVASTKTLWETGEVQSQSASKTPSCQVGVLPRIAKLGRLRMGSWPWCVCVCGGGVVLWKSKPEIAKVECGWTGFRAQGKIHAVLNAV